MDILQRYVLIWDLQAVLHISLDHMVKYQVEEDEVRVSGMIHTLNRHSSLGTITQRSLLWRCDPFTHKLQSCILSQRSPDISQLCRGGESCPTRNSPSVPVVPLSSHHCVLCLPCVSPSSLLSTCLCSLNKSPIVIEPHLSEYSLPFWF